MNNNLIVPEIELSVLGAILLEENVIEKAIEIIKPECFFNETNRKIYSVMLQMHLEGISIDTLSLYERIKHLGLKEITNSAFLSKLSLTVSSSANIVFHCRILFEKWYARKIIQTLDLTKKKIEEGFEDIFDIQEEIYNQLDSISDEFHSVTTKDKSLWEEFPETLYSIADRMQGNGSDLKSSTFPSFNIATGGLRESDLVCVFGKYKSGKSTFSLQLALDFALRKIDPVPIGIISLEMDKESVFLKALSMRTGIDYLKLRSPKENKLTQDELRELETAGIKFFKDSKIYIADQVFNRYRIKSKMKSWKNNFGVKLFLVDYLNLIESEKAERRDLQISEISRFFKLTAKELHTPIIMLTQANDEGKTAESKALMRDADFVFRVIKPREEGLNSIDKYTFSEDDFLINLLHSRHGKNGTSIVTRFMKNNFVEIETNYQNLKEITVKHYSEKEEEVF